MPLKQSTDRGKVLWLLFAVSYVLMNANAKFQAQSDELVKFLGFTRPDIIFQPFLCRSDHGKPTLILAKVVDGVMIAGDPKSKNVISSVNNRFKLVTIAHGLGEMHYFGLKILQHGDMSIIMNRDEKLMSIKSYPLTRLRS